MKKTMLSNALPRMTTVADAPFFALDWVPLEAVPESLRDRQCINCGGRYIDPLAAGKYQHAAGKDRYPRPRQQHAVAGQRGHTDWQCECRTGLSPHAQRQCGDQSRTGVRHAERQCHAARAKRAAAGRSARRSTPKPVKLSCTTTSSSSTGNICAAPLISCSGIQEGLIHIHNGNFTYCAPGEDDWSVLSKDMEVDLEEGLATAHHARVELEGVPVVLHPVAALASG